MKRFISMAIAAILTLSLAGNVLADSSPINVTTPETLNIAASISMTVPTDVTYTQGKAVNTQSVLVSNLTTDNTNGMKVEISVNATAAGKIDPLTRSLGATTSTYGWTKSVAQASPFIASGAIDDLEWDGVLVYSGSAVSAAQSFTFNSIVDATNYVPGSYQGSLIFVASTN